MIYRPEAESLINSQMSDAMRNSSNANQTPENTLGIQMAASYSITPRTEGSESPAPQEAPCTIINPGAECERPL